MRQIVASDSGKFLAICAPHRRCHWRAIRPFLQLQGQVTQPCFSQNEPATTSGHCVDRSGLCDFVTMIIQNERNYLLQLSDV
jgi:hypothetical protein